MSKSPWPRRTRLPLLAIQILMPFLAQCHSASHKRWARTFISSPRAVYVYEKCCRVKRPSAKAAQNRHREIGERFLFVPFYHFLCLSGGGEGEGGLTQTVGIHISRTEPPLALINLHSTVLSLPPVLPPLSGWCCSRHSRFSRGLNGEWS